MVRVRLSELAGKEIVNLTDATRIGVIRTAQALFDLEAGKVEAIVGVAERTLRRPAPQEIPEIERAPSLPV